MSPRKARRLPADVPRKPRGGVRRAAPDGHADGDADPASIRLGPEQTQEWPDGDWVVRQVPGAAATKTYRCPGCDQEIVPRTPHVVVWPADARDAGERRHWHNPCWQRRPRRPAPGYGRRNRRRGGTGE
ncbi:MAG TPA: ATP/GTP-binding protein [Streptosporangiaceae bacterium]|nr:ATP/GTP-binding protein [Streptosporangiaceae bacterium]